MFNTIQLHVFKVLIYITFITPVFNFSYCFISVAHATLCSKILGHEYSYTFNAPSSAAYKYTNKTLFMKRIN